VRMFAPILSFTAEEVWQHLVGSAEDSVLLHTWHEFPLQQEEEPLIARWTRIRELRSQVQGRLEETRVRGEIGSSLAAAVEIHTSGEDLSLLESLGDDLRLVLVTSSARVFNSEDSARGGTWVTPCAYTKCERCWHYREDIGVDPVHPSICGRCVSNLYGSGETRLYA
jgi:isoleucyl-tRNA synthetase